MSWGLDLEMPDGTLVEVFHGHTYNLTPMWHEAGVFERSINLDGERAVTLGARAATGLLRAVTSPERFKALNPENGWGDFAGFVEMITRLAILCAEHPDATVVWEG